MRKTLSTIIFSCILLLAYCSFTNDEDEVVNKEETPIEVNDTGTAPVEKPTSETDNEDVAEEKPDETSEESSYDEFYSDKITAEDIVYHWRNSGISAEELRDNTSKQCGIGKMNCVQLVTTEDVSVFIWPTAEEAQKVGSEYHDFTIENVTIRFNEPLSPKEDYIEELKNFFSTSS